MAEADGATALAPSPSDARGASLALEAVTVRFGGITALNDVDLAVAPGEVLGLIGPNGAGKTTLFDVISGLRPPDTGRVMLNGADITRLSSVARARRGLRRTFQRVQVFGWLTVEDNVLAALDWHGGGGGILADLAALPTRRHREQVRRTRTAEVLAQCGLTAVAKEPAASLPIGVARMVEVARAIVDQPTVLLLDEPTSGLDERECDLLHDLIESIRAGTNCGVVLVEHDVGFVMRQCQRIVVLDLGSVLAIGSPPEIQANTRVRTAYLGDI